MPSTRLLRLRATLRVPRTALVASSTTLLEPSQTTRSASLWARRATRRALLNRKSTSREGVEGSSARLGSVNKESIVHSNLFPRESSSHQ